MNRRIIVLSLLGLVFVGAFLRVDGVAVRGFAATQGTATIAVVGSPASPVALNATFNVTDELTAFAPGALSTGTWGGYNLEMQYDAAILSATTATAGVCGGFWSNPQKLPTLVTGCAFQSRTTTAILDNLTFTCIADGTSTLHLIGVNEVNPVKTTSGTALFDENAVNFDTTLVDGSVTCGSGPTSTPAPPTNTPTPTNTATSTPIPPSPTPTPTGGPATICTTNVGGPPTLGNGLDCDTDPLFGGVLGDGCVDSEDADPHDPWDFYSVPVPALLVSPGARRDNVVSAQDAQAVFRYFIASASAGSPVYEQDLNQNGVKDGWEYDRSVMSAGVTGPPDGVVTANDAQAAFAQFKAGKACSSGYNMAQPLCTTNVGGPPTLGIGRDCDRASGFLGFLGDGCVDSEDANANNPWDFYSVPVPSLLASPNALRDNLATAQDAQAVFSYFTAGATMGSPAYEQDLNHNGVKDGWEYDRSILAGGALGPPDGFITPQDAQAAFAQFLHGVTCSSGYNMKNTAP